MKPFSNRILSFAVLLTPVAVAGFSQSQNPSTPPEPQPSNASEATPGPATAPRNADLERELKTLTHVLSLTRDQQSGVRSILVQHFQQIKALNQKPPAESLGTDVHESPKARDSERQNILSESNQKIASILDPSQKKTFFAWLEKHPGDLVRNQPATPASDTPPPPQPAL